MAEKFYHQPDGRLVFNAVPSVGIENSINVSHLHGFHAGEWPANRPQVLCDDNIWAAFVGVKDSQAVVKLE